MVGLDTNVLARMIVRDDPQQTLAADHILDSAGDGGLFVSLIVLAEIAWVLDKVYGYSQPAVFSAIEDVLGGREFRVERAPLATEALNNSRNAKCDYADALIALAGWECGAETT